MLDIVYCIIFTAKPNHQANISIHAIFPTFTETLNQFALSQTFQSTFLSTEDPFHYPFDSFAMKLWKAACFKNEIHSFMSGTLNGEKTCAYKAQCSTCSYCSVKKRAPQSLILHSILICAIYNAYHRLMMIFC